jgi:hypothetical protein
LSLSHCFGSRVKEIETSEVATTSTLILSSWKTWNTLAMNPWMLNILVELISIKVTFYFSTSEVTGRSFFLLALIKVPMAEGLYEFLTLTGIPYSWAGLILRGWRT